MANEKNVLMEEFVNEFKRRTSYAIDETVRYKKVEEVDNQYDDVPDNIYATQDGIPSPNIPHMMEDEEEVNPEEVGDPTPEGPPGGEEEPMEEPMLEPEVEEPSVDELQNEIIRHNIEAMKAIHDGIAELNNTIMNLNQKVDTLNTEVEEVREPTNVEKLMAKKEVSYPYYMNLSDHWKGNWFDVKYSQPTEKPVGEEEPRQEVRGMTKLPDGTYIADYDDLAKFLSDKDIKDSFFK